MATDNNNNNNNTLHANYFIKGMNSDVSPEMADPQQYRFGLNVRINSYTSIQEALNPNNTAGALSPVPYGKLYEGINIKGTQVLCTDSINSIGIVITANEPDETGKKYWRIYRVVKEDDRPVFTEICKNITNKYTTRNKFTDVITYDSEDCIKLFIADGEHPIICINIHEDNIDYLNSLTNVEQIVDRYMYPCEQASLYEKISGTLPVSVIQYSYRFFKKNGVCSKISPLTRRFYTMNYTKDQEAGNKNGTSTHIGYRLSIPLIQDGTDFSTTFDHCQLFRIQQGGKTENTDADTKSDDKDKTDQKKDQEDTSGNDKESREGAETPIKAFLVQEFQLPKNDKVLYVEDTGLVPLQEFTLDEYATFTGETVIPQYISFLQKNLFAANIKDITVIEDDKLFYKSHTFSTSYDGSMHLYDPVSKTDKWIQYDDAKGDEQLLTQYYLPADYDINYTWHEHIMLPNDQHRVAGGTSDWVTWKMVTALTPLYNTNDNSRKLKPIYTGKWSNYLQYLSVRKDSNTFDALTGKNTLVDTNKLLKNNGCIIDALSNTNWQDPLYASQFRSLRRDDVYRYGIIYYTKYGQRTDVQWIADIKTPTLQEVPLSYFKYDQNFTVSLGLEFTVKCDDPRFKYYQIVRCPKNKQWSKNLYQVICARPMKHTTPSVLASTVADSSGNVSTGVSNAGAGRFSPWLPSPYVFDQILQYINTYWAANNQYYDLWSGYCSEKHQSNQFWTSSSENYLVQMFSEDINVNEDVVYDTLAGTNCWLKRAYTYDGLNYMNLNSSLNNYKTGPARLGYFLECNHRDFDCVYKYMDVKRRARTQEYYNNYFNLAGGRKFPIPQTIGNYGNHIFIDKWSGGEYIGDSYPSDYKNNPDRYEFFYKSYYKYKADNLPDGVGNPTHGTDAYFMYYPSRLNINLLANMDILDGGTGLAFTPTRYWDTIFYDASATYLSNGNLCNSEKPSFSVSYHFDSASDNSYYRSSDIRILSVAKAKEPQWDDGFSNITMEGSDVKSGSKTYKSFTSFVGGNTFCNWICNGMYDLRLSQKQSQYGVGVDYVHTTGEYTNAMGGSETLNGDGLYAGVFTALSGTLYKNKVTRSYGACGWIGPGTRCIIAALSNIYRIDRSPADGRTWGCNEDFGLGQEDVFSTFRDKIYMQFHDDAEHGYGQYSTLPAVTCSLTNIQHNASNFAGITQDQLQYDIYYSHGNFGKCNGDSIYVFDGDIFPTPMEIMPMHKTYDFQSIGDTIPSAQVNQFVLAESVFNSFFDYGYNFRNTQSDNIQLDVAQITGICSQDRPQYKQNMVFAENNVTLESFTAANLEKSNDTFPVRIVYGIEDGTQTIDNRTLFQANNYVDVGAEHGPITNIDASDNTLYFWQQHAFGKLAVNERSLVTDTNNNTIQLGQGGVLSRHDYLNEYYGMKEDVCNDIFADGTLVWYDCSAHSVIGYNQSVLDLGTAIGIQNIINSYSDNKAKHIIYYDIQNKEVSIDEFRVDGNRAQLVYNTGKLFTSFYTRDFDECLTLDGICYLIHLSNESLTQVNYLNNNDSFLRPSVVEFVVNNIPQYTKTFDNQQINTICRNYDEEYVNNFMTNKTFTFSTNMYDDTVVGKDNMAISDRECNIRYVIPRYENADYGNRIRGKWMKVRIEDNQPQEDYVISSIITNTRISFS